MKTGIYWQDPKYALKPGQDFIFDPSLVLYLPLYRLDGASFMSMYAYGHLCTATGALWTPRGRLFDGDDDKIDCGNSPSLTFGTGDFSLEAWVYVLNAITTQRSILTRGGASDADDGFRLTGEDGGNINFYISDGTTRTRISVITAPISTAGTWYHIVVIADRDANGIIYVNADVEKSGAITASQLSISGDRTLYIGQYTDASPRTWDGTIDEVRIYNRALTPLEVQRNYLATKWRYR